MDEDWLDEDLRALQTALHLEMASGPRHYSHSTQGINARLVPSAEHGNIINVSLLWQNNPKSLKGLSIRHVVPRHPTSSNKGDPVVFIRGPFKAQFRVVEDVDNEHVKVSEIVKKKSRYKKPDCTEHSRYDLVISQWPKARRT